LLIAVVNTEETIYKIKIILSLKKLLENGKNLQKEIKGNKIIYSYHGVASNALLRKATVNDTLNGHTSPKAITLISIVEGMGFTMTDFSKEFDNISEDEITIYRKEHS
jgi:DNA-binding phage protein